MSPTLRRGMLTSKSTSLILGAMFGERLHQLRQEKKLSVRALAERVDVDFSYISQIEHGKKQPSKDLVIRLARALGADEDELLMSAGHLPDDIGEILGRNPRRSLLYIREKLARYRRR